MNTEINSAVLKDGKLVVTYDVENRDISTQWKMQGAALKVMVDLERCCIAKKRWHVRSAWDSIGISYASVITKCRWKIEQALCRLTYFRRLREKRIQAAYFKSISPAIVRGLHRRSFMGGHGFPAPQ